MSVDTAGKAIPVRNVSKAGASNLFVSLSRKARSMNNYNLKPNDLARTAVGAVLVALLLTLTFAHPSSARADSRSDLFSSVGVSLTGPGGAFDRQAGDHPDLTIDASVPVDPTVHPDGSNVPGPAEALRSLTVDLPDGLVGNPSAIPTCTTSQLSNNHSLTPDCPVDAQIGMVTAVVAQTGPPGSKLPLYAGLYNLPPAPDVPASFGFNIQGAVTKIDAGVRPGDYGISSGSVSISQVMAVESISVELWGVPADPSHDAQRLARGAAGVDPLNPVPSTAPRTPFLTNPTSCTDAPVSFTFHGDTWERPGVVDTRTVTADPEGTPFIFDRCDQVPFSASTDVQPLSHTAEAPTGLSVNLAIPQNEDPGGIAMSDLRDTKIIFPVGMAISASAANGLGACSVAQIGIGSNEPPTCPDSSKIGTVKLKTPLLAEELEGDVILARQKENPFDSLLAMYLAIKGPGFYLKLPGKIEADPETGQLTSTFSDTPQLPFEDLQLELESGPQAPLVTPPSCGTYVTHVELTPWASASQTPVQLDSPMTIDQGCDTGGFAPKLNAGTTNPTGGAYSPFVLQVTREDGEENLSRIEATLPKGVLAKLAGVPVCPDAAAVSGACPATSQVGTTVVGVGPGTNPLYVPQAGKQATAVYLAGPYKGAPYSLVVEVPAQAGPFDLGTVTVRNALDVDPSTTQVTAKSDPLPQILEGIPLSYRDVRVEINRPEFTVNPTACESMKVTSALTSIGGRTANPSTPFAAANCERLGFKPTLTLRMSGPTRRAGNPALTATLKAPKGQANIASTTVILPRTVFIDQGHVGSPCTRVQFAADACPAASTLGTARAWSPLLEKPLEGPVYFRSNGGERQLPDLVADLNGQIHVVLVGFIDSKKVGKETSLVRTRFASVPDAPVSKFVLKLKGGKRSLIQNSANLCKVRPKAEVKMTGQNGKTNDFQQTIAVRCGKRAKKEKNKH